MTFLADLRTVLRSRDFRRLFGTRLLAQTSDGIFQIALASYIFFNPDRQPSAQAVAAAWAALLLPYSLVGPFAGVLLDRWRRRQVLVWANVIRAAMVVGVAGLVLAGTEGLPFYASALAVLSVNRFFLAGLSAALPHVVATAELVMANSVAATSGTIAAVIGGGIGYLARTLLGESAGGTAGTLVIAALVYLGSAVVATRIDKDRLGPEAAGPGEPVGPGDPRAAGGARSAVAGVAIGMIQGARHVRERAAAGRALGTIAVHRFCYGVSTIMTVLLYRNYFNNPANAEAGLSGLAVVVAASGLGYLTAAGITPPGARYLTKPGWIVASFGLAAVVQVTLAASFKEPLIVLAAYFLGVVAQGVKICVDTIVQATVDDAYRGRVFSFYDVLFNVSFVGAAAFAAVLLPSTGKSQLVIGIVAAGYVLAGAGYGLAELRSQRSRPRPLGGQDGSPAASTTTP
ncbi:MAG TPA: MFS transporter [Actinomycetes bacterium]|nr:MFS transporter [Actinomycetes bacterium]